MLENEKPRPPNDKRFAKRIEITWWIPSSHLFHQHHQWLHNILSKRFAVRCSISVTKLISLEFCLVNFSTAMVCIMVYIPQMFHVPLFHCFAHWQWLAAFSLKNNKLDKRVVFFPFFVCVYVCIWAPIEMTKFKKIWHPTNKFKR